MIYVYIICYLCHCCGNIITYGDINSRRLLCRAWRTGRCKQFQKVTFDDQKD